MCRFSHLLCRTVIGKDVHVFCTRPVRLHELLQREDTLNCPRPPPPVPRFLKTCWVFSFYSRAFSLTAELLLWRRLARSPFRKTCRFAILIRQSYQGTEGSANVTKMKNTEVHIEVNAWLHGSGATSETLGKGYCIATRPGHCLLTS